MRDQIADAAKNNNRSMNAEIVARLQQSFSQPAGAPLNAEQVAEIALQKFLDRQGVLQRQTERGKIGPKKA